ncbi:MAG: YaeQ family protein [Campylobacterota bacterium]|nr:YaeQ family protein [Campylobacterota bacterium]
MALGATIYKVSLSVADMDRHYYNDFDLTIAQHPSENNLRMMVRLIAFALHADESLSFTKGLSQEDEPELWKKNFGGEIELWIDLGQPDEKRIRKACGRSEQVIIYTYNHKAADAWWRQNEGKLRRFKNLRLIHLSFAGEPESLIERSMQLQCNIQDAELLLLDERENSVSVTQEEWA